jgi:hypothetical protein
MATKIKIKKSQLQQLINEQLKLLKEQQENNFISKIMGDKLYSKFKINKNKLTELINKITNAKSPDEIKNIAKKHNPNIDSQKVDELSKKIMKNKTKSDHKTLYNYLSLIIILLGIIIGVETPLGAFAWIIGAIVGTYFHWKVRPPTYDNKDDDDNPIWG